VRIAKSVTAIKVDAFVVKKVLISTARTLHNARKNVNTLSVPPLATKTDFVSTNHSVRSEWSQSSKLQLGRLTGAAGML
jgi:hypothetical protein